MNNIWFCSVIDADMLVVYQKGHLLRNAERAIILSLSQVTSRTWYNVVGQPLVSVEKQLLSELSEVLETKTAIVDERGLTTAEWTEYDENTKRIQKSVVPSSSVTAQTVAADGFALSAKSCGHRRKWWSDIRPPNTTPTGTKRW